MPLSTTLHEVSPRDVMRDVYFRRDFLALHARPDGIDMIAEDDFRHAAAIRRIPGTDLSDLETPWGYGGPVASDITALRDGLARWRQRQGASGRVAEFVRLHPFLNPMAMREAFDILRFDRLTVVVDLAEPAKARWRHYSKGTRYSINTARKKLRIRRLGAAEAPLFRALYEAGLARNRAADLYYFDERFYGELVAAEWAETWVAEADEPVAVACFLHGGPFAHYHLSGGTDAARRSFAHYLLIEHAITYFAQRGKRWLHLGGGQSATPDDSLYRFKTRFSPLRLPFYTGGLVFDRAAYVGLARDNDRILSYRFPVRRASTIQDVVRLRPARHDDLEVFFRIKCGIEDILWSGHAQPPEWETLAAWFHRQFEQHPVRRIFVAERGGKAVGYLYLDDRGDHLEVSVAVAADETGHGVCRTMLREVARMLGEAGERRPLAAWIFPDNVASVRAFEAAGFAKEDGGSARSRTVPFGDGRRDQHCWVRRAEAEDSPVSEPSALKGRRP